MDGSIRGDFIGSVVLGNVYEANGACCHPGAGKRFYFPVSKLKPLDIGGEMSQQMCCFYRFKFAVRSVDYPLIVQVVAFEVEALF